MVDVLLGLQWGDEGKGKIVDFLTPKYQVVARFQGGPNAGHTLEFEGIKHVLHTIPSGIFHEQIINIVGNGVVIDPVVFAKEIRALNALHVDVKKNLFISRKAHLILPTHRLLDAASEAQKGANKIGSTLRGIGPAYMDKTGRNGLRVGDIEANDFMQRYQKLKEKHISILSAMNFGFNLADAEPGFFEGVDLLRSLNIIDSEHVLNSYISDGKKILAEGAQGSLLDVDFGSYPFVTSSNTITAGACTGLGIPPGKIGEVFGIFKAYSTRVGSGPFPTELMDVTGEKIRKAGNEFGSTTGRPRRTGWLDIPALKYACMINGVTQLMMMKSDVLSGFEQVKVGTAYQYKGNSIDYMPFDVVNEKLVPEYTACKGWNVDLTKCNSEKDMPVELTKYVAFIESQLQLPVSVVSVGPDRRQTIVRNSGLLK